MMKIISTSAMIPLNWAIVMNPWWKRQVRGRREGKVLARRGFSILIQTPAFHPWVASLQLLTKLNPTVSITSLLSVSLIFQAMIPHCCSIVHCITLVHYQPIVRCPYLPKVAKGSGCHAYYHNDTHWTVTQRRLTKLKFTTRIFPPHTSPNCILE